MKEMIVLILCIAGAMYCLLEFTANLYYKEHYDGVIEDVRVYPDTLSKAQRDSIYHETKIRWHIEHSDTTPDTKWDTTIIVFTETKQTEDEMIEKKFRVWDKLNKKMIYEIDCIEFLKGKVDCISYFGKDGHSVGVEVGKECELIQYTGIHDKNGREIYEGDVLKCRFFSGDLKTGVVIFNEKEAFFALDGNWCIGRYEKEIIGNIYENPELCT